MDYLKQFLIPFAGLKTGKHLFHFTIGKEFLSHYSFPDFEDISVAINFSLDKQSSMLTLNFELEGMAKTLCDRCGDDFNLPLQSNQELFIKLGQASIEESEKIVVIPSSETEIEISQYIYEFITFAIPFKKIHAEGKCNAESLKKLKEINEVSEKKETDPRWLALTGIKDNLF